MDYKPPFTLKTAPSEREAALMDESSRYAELSDALGCGMMDTHKQRLERATALRHGATDEQRSAAHVAFKCALAERVGRAKVSRYYLRESVSA